MHTCRQPVRDLHGLILVGRKKKNLHGTKDAADLRSPAHKAGEIAQKGQKDKRRIGAAIRPSMDLQAGTDSAADSHGWRTERIQWPSRATTAKPCDQTEGKEEPLSPEEVEQIIAETTTKAVTSKNMHQAVKKLDQAREKFQSAQRERQNLHTKMDTLRRGEHQKVEKFCGGLRQERSSAGGEGRSGQSCHARCQREPGQDQGA